MKHKLAVPWTSRLPVTRWWVRRHSPLTSYTASSQGEFPEGETVRFHQGHVLDGATEKH